MLTNAAPIEPTPERKPKTANVDIETLNRQAKLYAVSGKVFSAINEALTPPVDCDDATADRYETAYQTLKAARVQFSASRREFDEANRDHIGQLKQFRKDAANERLNKVSAQVKAMFDAAIKAAAPVEERKLPRRESLELDKKIVTEELDEYLEGLLDAEADPDIPQSHYDFLNRSIGRLLNEYYDICKQLDELDDEPKPAPNVNGPIVGTETTTAFESDYGYRNYDVNGESVKFYYGESPTATAMLITSTQYGAQLYRKDTGNIEFLARPNRSDNGYTGEEQILDAEEFFKVMAERGACTIDQPTLPKPGSPCAIANGLNDIFNDTVRGIGYMDVTTQGGAKIVSNFGAAYISVDWRDMDGYVFGNHYDDVLARYETAQQVIDVMTALRDTIKRGDTAFTFPPANEIQPPELTDREKFLKAKAQIKTEPGRLLNNGNFGTKWIVRDEHGNRKRVSKATAAAVLNAFGLTPATYLDEKEKWVADEIARAGLDIAAADFAASVIAPAKVLALPVPVEPAAVEDEGDVFSLLPKLEDLNDVDDECDEDAAEYTDRDDRYNRGEKIAEALTAKLRPFDPTVEVTYTIDEDGEDIYYLSYDGIVRTPFTATGVESSFHAMKDDAPTDRYDDDELIDEPEVKAPADEFTAKLAAFDAEIAQAETARDAAKAAYDKADVAAQNAIAARQDFLDKTAGVLTEKLHATCVGNDFIETATVNGCPYTIGDIGDIYVDATTNGRFVFVTWNNRPLARYDTPAQVETVIAKIKGVIERREAVFYFPTVGELERKVKLEDSLARAMKTAPEHYKGFCYTGNLTKAEYELKLYNICRKATHELKGSLK